MGTFKNLEQIVLIVSFIPYQAFLMIDAILITLYRVCISKQNLLEWQSAEFVEKSSSNEFYCLFKENVDCSNNGIINILSIFL